MAKNALAKKTSAPVLAHGEAQIQVQDIPSVNPNNVQSVYSNSVSIMNGQFDIRLLFNEIVSDGIGRPVQSVLRANVALTPAHAKALSEALVNALSQYPQAFGEIPWPPKRKSKLKSPPFQFTINNCYGVPVSCTVETWKNHILSRPLGVAHAELDGREEDVKTAIADPSAIYPSNSPDSKGNAFVHEIQTTSDYVRAVVAVTDPKNMTAGSGKGYLITAYPSTSSYSATAIYVKPKGGK